MIPPLQTISWQPFLARPLVQEPPRELLDALLSRPILITGAGGSIGSALARRLVALAPPHLLLLDSSESRLETIQRECATSGARFPIVPILGYAADATLIENIFAAHGPSLVFHAAAYKHVPLMEEHPLAAIANNIFATETLTRLASAHHARVLLLSTDKAVQPSSVMGATKRVAEHIVLAAGGTVMRLGNVLASRDSVAEVFAHQIAGGGPITVTDPAARRYFLTLHEAVDLLLFAAAHRERSALLAPVLPSTHFISDLAHFMANKLAPGRVIALEFTALRPGDKETELLWSPDDLAQPMSLDPSISALPPTIVSIQSSSLTGPQLDTGLAALRTALDARDVAAALTGLQLLVPDFTPSHAVLSLAREGSTQVSR